MTVLRYLGAFFGMASAVIVYMLVRMPRMRHGIRPAVLWCAALSCAGFMAWSLAGQTVVLCGLVVLAALMSFMLRRVAPDVTLTGHGIVAASIGAAAGLSSWTVELTTSFGWPDWLRDTVLVAQTALFLLVFLLSTSLRVFSLGDLTVRQRRRDAALAWLATHPRIHLPKVCVQVPCYSEPPELVIATLDAIARLDYPDYEVVVIDNNTKDPALWQPVQAHCMSLGKRFRFFHVDALKGAKAGALNYITPLVSADVELIAVVDADYVVEVDFLRRWSPLFEDAQTAFVQTTHEYRDWEHSNFLARFYPSYIVAHKVTLPALTQMGAEILVGTMCLVRRSALEEVGGWAEWCQTEDSELAIRLHARGYRGYYFADPCGRGLIPETLDRMRKQRFRWAYGPVQQLRYHWRLYFGLSKEGSLTWSQRYFQFMRSFEHLPEMIWAILFLPVGFAVYREVFEGATTVVGVDFLLLCAAVIFTRRLMATAQLELVGRAGWADILLNAVTVSTIRLYEVKGTVLSMLRLRWPWQRTDKFPVTGSLRRGVSIALPDLMLLVMCWGGTALLYPYAHFTPVNYTGLSCLGLGLIGSLFLTSFAMCIFHEIDLKRRGTNLLRIEPGKAARAPVL